jgi:pyridoxine/pyridoxamine 5'-phosphate oxidase
VLQRLEQIETALWRELQACTDDPLHGWRVAVLATRDGEAADARCVVLREVEHERREVVFFADARSPKIAQMTAQPQAMLVLWSQALSWQLRLQVSLAVQTEGLAVSSRWARLKLTPAAQDYLSPLAPGSRIEQPAAALPSSSERGTRAHFCVVTASVHSIDWLELSAQGHRRARFDAAGAHWLTP